MKRFSVIYEVVVSLEAVVKSKNVKEAKNKVLEVMGDVKITDAWEVKE